MTQGAGSETQIEQSSLMHAGQRRVSLIWERTQAFIALFVVVGTFFIGGYLVFTSQDKQIPTIFAVAFGMVVGFYFGRTNHSAVGGPGPKLQGGEYTGR